MPRSRASSASCLGHAQTRVRLTIKSLCPRQTPLSQQLPRMSRPPQHLHHHRQHQNKHSKSLLGMDAGKLPTTRARPSVPCTDPTLQVGDRCPHCAGHLYDTNAPSIFIRLAGQPIVGATRYEQQVLRCSSCQERFTAPLPEGVPAQKYDATVDVALALAKYGAGIPCYRLEQMQQACGVPLPQSVQFARSEVVADTLLPVYLQMRELAACGEVFYVDDTRVRILDFIKENKQLQDNARKGMQTSTIVAEVGTQLIALYFSGRRHAGENMQQLLVRRRAD